MILCQNANTIYHSLIDLQDLRLLRAESEFESTLKTLESDFRGEAKKIEGQHESEKYELLGIIRAVESEELERGSERRQEHEQTREEIRNKNLEDINVLRITLDGLIEELEAHFETAHLNYLQTTDQRTQDFKFLTAKDRDLSRGRFCGCRSCMVLVFFVESHMCVCLYMCVHIYEYSHM